MEVYFWTFVVAILIFAIGAGVSIYQGVSGVLHPHRLSDPSVNYVVLAIAMVFEAGAWWIAFKEFGKARAGQGFLAALRSSKDPTVFTVLFEDSAALLGLVVAFVGIAAAQALDAPELDGVASILIGLILGTIAALLAYESKSLLVGEAASPRVVDGIEHIISEEPAISRVTELLTMHLGPADVLVNPSLDFSDERAANEVEAAISALERRIKATYPEVTRVFIEAQSWLGHLRDRTRLAAASPDAEA